MSKNIDNPNRTVNPTHRNYIIHNIFCDVKTESDVKGRNMLKIHKTQAKQVFSLKNARHKQNKF